MSFRTLLKNTNRKPYTIYRMEALSMTLSELWPPIWRSQHFYVLLEDQDANVIIALALHSALLQLLFFLKAMTYAILLISRSVAQAAWQAPWNWTHLSPGPWLQAWFQAKTQQPIGVVDPVIIHVNGLAILLGFVDMLPAAIVDVSVVRLLCVLFS